MYQIDPKFLRPDGSIRIEDAMEAGRRERAAVIGVGCEAIVSALRRGWHALKTRPGSMITASRGDLPGTDATA